MGPLTHERNIRDPLPFPFLSLPFPKPERLLDIQSDPQCGASARFRRCKSKSVCLLAPLSADWDPTMHDLDRLSRYLPPIRTSRTIPRIPWHPPHWCARLLPLSRMCCYRNCWLLSNCICSMTQHPTWMAAQRQSTCSPTPSMSYHRCMLCAACCVPARLSIGCDGVTGRPPNIHSCAAYPQPGLSPSVSRLVVVVFGSGGYDPLSRLMPKAQGKAARIPSIFS